MKSIFDIVPMHRQFKLTVRIPSPNVEEYRELQEKVHLFFDYIKKNLETAKRDIKSYSYGDKMRQTINEQMEELEKKHERKPLEEFVVAYERIWNEHDEFAIMVGKFTLSLINGEIYKEQFLRNCIPLIKKAISNDIGLHVYTFALQSILNGRPGGENIVVPFEWELNEDSLLLSEQEFADKYTYGDASFAKRCIRRCSALSISQLERIADHLRISYFREKKDDSFYWRNRIAFWEAFEEPRRRYSAIYGIFDYFFREAVFLLLKEKGEFRGKTSALQIPQHEILNRLNERIKNG